MALTRIQATSATNTTFASVIQTSAITTTTGHLVIVAAEADTVAANGITITDNKSNTWTRVLSTAPTGIFDLEIWYSVLTTGGTNHKFTATDNGGGVDSVIVVEEWSGAATVSITDGSASANGNSTALASGSITTTNANDLIWSAGVVAVGSAALTLGSGYSNLTQANTSFSDLGIESQVVSATSSFNGTFSSSTSANWAAGIVAIKQFILNGTKTQPAVARVANNRTKTQSATAHVLGMVVKTQPTKARIANNLTKTQTATAHIIQSGAVLKSYIYKVYSGSSFLGLLPNVTSEFTPSQDINTSGSQITITVGQSADVSGLPSVQTIDDESGVALQGEDGDNLLTEGAVNILALGGSTQSLIKNGNRVIVIEYSEYYPNGRQAFVGEIDRWEAAFGQDQESINLLVYSDGQDLNNYIVQGSPLVNDVSSTTNDQTYSVNQTTGVHGGITYNYVGQTFTTGGSITNIGGIGVLMEAALVGVNMTLYLWPDVASANANTGLLGTASLTVTGPGGTPAEQIFVFSSPVPASATTSYFFTVVSALGGAVPVCYNDAAGYAGGDMYISTSTTPTWTITPTDTVASLSDLAFKTYHSAGATTAVFSAQDPTTGMLETFMTAYGSQGGSVTYTSGTIDATGLSVPYTFNTSTIYSALQTILSLSPAGFYWYVDLGTDVLHFKQTSTTADFVLTKGNQIQSLNLVATIENIVNLEYFSGGIVSGNNLFSVYQDSTSIGLYGQRLNLDSDNRVTVQATADAIGNSEIAQNKDEQFQTTVVVLDRQMDISLFHVGNTIGLNGFGSFIDQLILQIVRVDYTPEAATLTLGILPPRTSLILDQVTRELIAEQTVDNPTSPS